MPEELKVVNIVAAITIGSKIKKITIHNLCMSCCIARLNFEIKPFEHAVLQLSEDNGRETPSFYAPIKITIETVTQNESDPEAYYAKIKFNGIVTANQGVVQSLHSEKPSPDTQNHTSTKDTTRILSQGATNSPSKTTSGISASKLNSVSVTPVRCHMCSQKKIPFWSLQNRTMLSKTNIFGVSSYTEAMPRRDFCDFNLIRVIVCPKCFFASSDILDFKKENGSQGFSRAPFDKKAISKQWDKGISARKKLVAPHLDGFFDDERNLEQALLSYDLAIITGDEMFKSDEMLDPKRRKYHLARKAIYYMMTKAELLINNENTAAAEKILQDVIIRLETIFPYLQHEPSIRAGFLLGMLSLYFEDYLKLGQYLTFLREFNKDGKIAEDSEEYKTLSTSLKKLDEAYQNRAEYSKTNLTRFEKPF